MTEAFEEVVATVRERLTPDVDERERLETVRETVTERAERAVADLAELDDPTAVDVVQVGSTARDTWLSGERDVDVFVRFPTDLDREELERFGLAVGRTVLPDGREEYAEHPYVHGEVDGFDVDLVPCYDVADATAIRSAVDRTPFHTRYVAERVDPDLAGEIRVAKGFLSGIGVYGSDLRTRGFSGYLTELLVLEYGDFRGLVDAAADWSPPVVLDPAEHGTASFDDPLVVVDPTDPERNVAAVCSAEAVATLQHYARAVLADPRVDLFEPDEPDPVAATTVREAFERRGTTPVALAFDAPDIVDDQLYPQLEKSRRSLRDALDRRGFDVLRSAAFANDRAVLLFELAVADRPAVERHAGPPVHVRDHAAKFYEAYAEGAPSAEVFGPWIDGDRYMVERDREYRTASAFLESDAVFDVALGADLAEAMTEEYAIRVGEEVAELAGSFGRELAAYLDPEP